MRVVFLTHNFPRWPGDLSGSFLGTLATALVARGVDVSVVAPSDEGKGGDDEVSGVRVRRVRYASPRLETLAYRGTMTTALRAPGGWRALAGLWRALRRAAKEELAAGADLIHAHWWVPAGLAAPHGVPMVLTVHGTDAALLRKSRLARRLARPVFRRATLVTAVSRELAGWVQNATGRHIAAAHVQPMPVNSADWPWTTGGGGAVVIARLTAQKRINLAIETTAFLASCGHDLPLTIVGDGPERAALERQVERLGIGSFVRFAGAVSPTEVAGYLMPGGSHARARGGRGLRSGCGRSPHGRRPGRGLLGRRRAARRGARVRRGPADASQRRGAERRDPRPAAGSRAPVARQAGG